MADMQQNNENDQAEVEKEAECQEDQKAESADSEASSRPYGALKCYFYTPKRGDIWGAFCFLFDGVTGSSVGNTFWTTRLFSPESIIDVSMGWRDFSKLISTMGPYEKAIGEKLIALLHELFPASARKTLIRNVEDPYTLHNLTVNIRKNFERVTHCFLEFETAFEFLTRQDLLEAGLLSQQKVKPERAPTQQRSFEGTLITCLPVIDPVWGKPVSELTLGDMLEVKLQSEAGASDLIRKFLYSTKQEAIFPVELIEKGADDKTFVFLKISDEIKGLITVSKDLRLRTLRPKNAKKRLVAVNTDNLVFFGVLGAVLAAAVLVVRYLFF